MEFVFNWSRVDLQYCVSFRCTVKWSRYTDTHTHTYLIAQLVKNPSAMQETPVGFLGQDHLLEKGISYPLQYSGLENSMDCIVHEVAKSQTQLSDFHLSLIYTHTLFQTAFHCRLLGIRTFKSFRVTLMCSKFWKPLWSTLYLLIPFEDLCHLPVRVFCFWEL